MECLLVVQQKKKKKRGEGNEIAIIPKLIFLLKTSRDP